MDRESRRRYFIFGSAILEIVTPVFKDRLENECKKHGNGTLQVFMNRQLVKHTMFHLRHRYVWCCIDQPNCTNNSALPLNSSQWKLLYTENPGPGPHHCHCKYTAKSIKMDELDMTLAGLILVNCCNLSPVEEQAIRILRQYRNDYFAHNTDGTILQADYDRLWPYLTTYILQLDKSKQDELTRIQNRPLDEQLCNKYATLLIDVQKRLDEIDNSISQMNVSVQGTSNAVQGNNNLLQGNTVLLQTVNTNIQKLLFYAERGMTCRCYLEHLNDKEMKSRKPYKLGQSIFSLHRQTKLPTEFSGEKTIVSDGVMMDNGRLVLCQFYPCKSRLLIFNTESSDIDSIPVQYRPHRITAINHFAVAITLWDSNIIEIYDINNKHKINSFTVPGMWCFGITTLNNKLVVGGEYCLYIINHQTGEVAETISTGENFPFYLYSSGDRVFYNGDVSNNKLYCYNFSKDKTTTKALQFQSKRMTSLQDGSLYVKCHDGSLQHVSSDGQHFKPVTTEGLESLEGCYVISYNNKERKLFTCSQHGTINSFKEK